MVRREREVGRGEGEGERGTGREGVRGGKGGKEEEGGKGGNGARESGGTRECGRRQEITCSSGMMAPVFQPSCMMGSCRRGTRYSKVQRDQQTGRDTHTQPVLTHS